MSLKPEVDDEPLPEADDDDLEVIRKGYGEEEEDSN
jgi:hypothetical protein